MILTAFKNIKAVFLDVDGVLTDNTILVTEQGEQLRTFSTRDGYAMQYAIKQGLILMVITGGRSEGVRKRLEGLGLSEIYLNVSDKIALMDQLCEKYQLTGDDCMYIGDDIPDYSCMKKVGLAVAPNDAAEEIKQIAHFISPFAGGKGVVRDALEKVLKLQGLWMVDQQVKSI